MKDSGIEWIGEIPEEWEISPLFSIFKERKQKNYNLKETNILSLSYGKIIRRNTETNMGLLPESFETYNIVDKSNIILRLTDLQNDKTSLRTGLVIERGIITSAYIALESINTENVFFHYLLHCYDELKVFYVMGNGVRQNLKFAELSRLPLLVPPLAEQQRIADYLDAKCAYIDQCLELTRQSMEKLRAYKLSCITEAVTKGLDPDVPLKDSGVPWIGQIPQHCRCVAVNKLFYLILGKMLSDKPKNHDDSLEEYICALNVHFDGIDYDSLKKMWFSKNEKFTYKVMNNDLLVVEGGAGAGGSYIATNIQNKNIYIQNSIIIAREKESISNTRFLYYTLFSLVKRNYIDFICNKATIPHFTKEKLGRTVLVLFPLPEQERIAAYLDKKCARIDALLEEKQALLDKLAEYKKSLIFEYVTGKREVPSCWNR